MPEGAVSATRMRREGRLQAGQEGLLQTVPGNDAQHDDEHGQHGRRSSVTARPSRVIIDDAAYSGGYTLFRRLQVSPRRAVRERHGVASPSALARRDEVRQVSLQGENPNELACETFERAYIITRVNIMRRV